MPYYLHSLTEIKRFMEGFSGSSQDDLLLDIMANVYGRFEDETGRTFLYAEATETFKRTAYSYLPLRQMPVDEDETITVVERYYTNGTATNTTLVENRDYYVLEHGIQLINYTLGYDYLVTYSGGYSADSSSVLVLPQSAQGLKRAALIQCAHEYNTRTKPGTETLQTDIGSITSDGLVLLSEVRKALRFYRHPSREMLW